MSHPCDGHACDHCYLCDVVGICCATVPSAAHTSSSLSDAQADAAVRSAVVDERDRLPSLSVLVRIEAARALPPASEPAALLPPPSTDLLVDVIYGDEREECHEPAARS